MAIYCIDYINGVNAPGGGTAANPWRTIGYAQTQITTVVGDEFRVNAGVAPTLLTTTATKATALTYAITTGVDLTGSLAANDYIFIGDDLIAPFRIQSITSTTITLYSTTPILPEFFGAGVNFSIWKTGGVPVVINAAGDSLDTFATSSSFVKNSDSVIISGGWNSTYDAKTAFGKTFFYRTTTTGFTPSNIYRGNIFINTQNSGYVFKDFNASGYLSGFITSSGATTLLCANQKIDNCVFAAYMATNISTGSITPGTDVYATNMTIIIGGIAGSTLELKLHSGSISSGIYYLNGYTIYVTGRFTTGNGAQLFRLTETAATSLRMELGAIKLINRMNSALWGANSIGIPDPFRIAGLPNTIPNNQYQNYIKVNDVIVEGYPGQLFSLTTFADSPLRKYINLSSASLSGLSTIGPNAYGASLTIKAPGSPFNTQSGMFLSAAQNFSTGSMNAGYTNPIVWMDTTSSIDYYIYGQCIMYLNTSDYVTGSNSLSMKPATVGGTSVFGFSAPVGATFFKKSSETATITIKMKLIGSYPSGIPTITLFSNPMLRERVSYTVTSGTDYNSAFSTLAPSVNPTTTGWTDVVYTFPADTSVANDEMIGYKLYLTEGAAGSRLALAGNELLVDSVNILIS